VLMEFENSATSIKFFMGKSGSWEEARQPGRMNKTYLRVTINKAGPVIIGDLHREVRLLDVNRDVCCWWR